MGFFKFLKKGKREEGRDLDAAMSWEDIPPAPKPFEMKPQAPPDQFQMPEMPDLSKIGESGDNLDIPNVPEIGEADIEKTIAPPSMAPGTSKDEKFFEDIPFPGVGRKDFVVMPKTELAPPRAFDAPQPRPAAMPPLEPKFEAPAPKPEPKAPPEPIILEPPKPTKMAPEPKKAAPVAEEEHDGEFKYLKERSNVDFAKPLFLNLEQCETIVDATNDIRRDLADYEESYQKLCDSFTVSDKQFQKWRLCLEDALKKLFDIDKGLFKAG